MLLFPTSGDFRSAKRISVSWLPISFSRFFGTLTQKLRDLSSCPAQTHKHTHLHTMAAIGGNCFPALRRLCTFHLSSSRIRYHIRNSVFPLSMLASRQTVVVFTCCCFSFCQPRFLAETTANLARQRNSCFFHPPFAAPCTLPYRPNSVLLAHTDDTEEKKTQFPLNLTNNGSHFLSFQPAETVEISHIHQKKAHPSIGCSGCFPNKIIVMIQQQKTAPCNFSETHGCRISRRSPA